MPDRTGARPIYVTVVSENAATIDGLHGYLNGAGVASHAFRALPEASVLPAETTTIVIFPDEFAVDNVVTSITSLRAARPRVLILLVTGAPQRFRSALIPDGQSFPPIVVPKPAFGWTILDAIRAHSESDSR